MGEYSTGWHTMFLLLFQIFLISQVHLGSSLPVEEDRGIYDWIFGEDTTTTTTTTSTTTTTTTTTTTKPTTTTTTTPPTTQPPEATNIIDVIQEFFWGANTTPQPKALH